MTTEPGQMPDDPVAVYDVMREAANRLIAVHIGRVIVGGPEDPAIQRAIMVRDEVRSVDVDDPQAQKRKTAELVARYRALVAE